MADEPLGHPVSLPAQSFDELSRTIDRCSRPGSLTSVGVVSKPCRAPKGLAATPLPLRLRSQKVEGTRVHRLLAHGLFMLAGEHDGMQHRPPRHQLRQQ